MTICSFLANYILFFDTGQTQSHKNILIHEEKVFDMKRNEQPIKAIIENPPSKEQAEKRIKELVLYLEQIWKLSLNKS